MPSGPLDPDRSPGHPGLILRVLRPGGQAEEFYLAGGLTIGRSTANTIVLAGDASVDRTHARVELGPGGNATLRCVEPGGSLATAAGPVGELRLAAGVRFRLGGSDFRCFPGPRGASEADDRASSCPFCGSRASPGEDERAFRCAGCGNPILPIRPDQDDPSPLLVPLRYGPYRARHLVARGGMGVVLRGSDEGGGRPVAIKVLLDGAGAGRGDPGRFEREVEMMERVRSPHVVRLLGHGEAGRFRYLILEWVDGPSLRQKIDDARRAGHRARFERCLEVFERICKGVAALHAAGVIHRDIKPGNILVDRDGIPRLADLGIAVRAEAARTAPTADRHPAGTSEYMAPEQIDAPDAVDGRADLYSLGVTFYEVLTMTRPVGAWPPASSLNRSVPPSFDRVLRRLMDPDPGRRPSDIYDLLSALATYRDALPDSTRGPIPERRGGGERVRLSESRKAPPGGGRDWPSTSNRAAQGAECEHQTPDGATPIRDDDGASSPSSPTGPGPDAVGSGRTEEGRIVARRARCKSLSLLLVLPGILLNLIAAIADPTLPGVVVSVSGGRLFMTSAFALAAAYRGFHALLGVYYYLGLLAFFGGGIIGDVMIPLLLIALLPDRQRSRQGRPDPGGRSAATPTERPGRLPPYFWSSVLSSPFLPIAPVALWLAILGYRERPDKRRVPFLSLVAMLWAGYFTLLFSSLLLLVAFFGPSSHVGSAATPPDVRSIPR